MYKRFLSQIISFLVAVSLVASVCAVGIMFTASAAPDLPENAVVVLDKEGHTQAIGANYQQLWYTMLKTNTPADFSQAVNIEFDITFSDYEKLFNEFGASGVNIYFSLTSSNNQWNNRVRTVNDILSYCKKGADGWYHFSMPKADFYPIAGVIDWSAVKVWMIGFEGNVSAAFKTDISAETITVKNICGTIVDANEPAISGNANCVIDEEGNSFELGSSYSSLYYNSYKKLSEAADLSGSEYIEFDIKYSSSEQKEALKSALKNASGSRISMALMSSESDTNRNITTDDFFSFEVSSNGEWSHYRIPRSAFGYGNIDWTAVNAWRFYFEGLSGATGSLATLSLKVINLCGTIDKPQLPKNAVCIFDEFGNSFAVGGAYSSLYYNSYKKLSSSADFSEAEFVEFDIKYSSSELKLALQEALKSVSGSRISMALMSSESDVNRNITTDDFFSFEVSSNGEWHHYKIPKLAFGYGNIDWSAVNAWRFYFEGITGNTGDLSALILTVANICGTTYANPEPPESAVMMDMEGMSSNLGGSFVYLFDLLNKKVSEPVDFSKVDFIEFDIKFSNFEKLAAALIENELYLTFNFTSSGNQWDDRVCARHIFRYAHETGEGWFHFKVPKEEFITTHTGDIDWSAINLWMAGFDGDSTKLRGETGELANIILNVINVCGTFKNGDELLRPALSSDAIYTIDQLGAFSTLGESESDTYEGISDRFSNDSIINGNLTLSKYVSMQLYIDDVKLKPLSLSLSFGVEDEEIRYLNPVDISGQITSSGWNEVIIPISSIIPEKEDDLESIACWKLESSDSSVLGSAAGCRMWVCNMIGIVTADAPELPKNVIALLNYRGISSTVGLVYSWLGDRAYVENLGGIDVSDASFIELDLYISDYEAIKAVFEAEGSTVTALDFAISSGDPQKYAQPRYFNRNAYSIFDQIKGDGWNHIKIPFAEMYNTGEGELDPKNITSFMLSFNGENIQVVSEENADVLFKIINVCATAVRPIISIAPDEEKPSKPDKNAVYINSAEALFDENGTWNPIAVKVDKEYKSEGKASVSNSFYNQSIRSNQLRFLFNETADISDIKTLKFDIFIRDVALLRERAAMSVLLSNDIRGTKDYYSWKLDLSSLNDGWNTVSIDTDSGFITDGNPNLSKIKSFIVQCDEATFRSDEYRETVTVKLDNIRYISKIGRTSLKINSAVSEDLDLNFGLDFDLDFDIEAEEDIPAEAPAENTEKKVQIINKEINNSVVNYTWLITILSIEAVAAAAILTVVYFIRRKKN